MIIKNNYRSRVCLIMYTDLENRARYIFNIEFKSEK